jgi:hypothetical protein
MVYRSFNMDQCESISFDGVARSPSYCLTENVRRTIFCDSISFELERIMAGA